MQDEAGQAAVDMRDDLGVGRPAVLQHVLDQVDAAARAIELVAEHHIGRTGRRAEAAMHAFAQDLLRLRDMRIGELRGGEIGLHRSARIRAGVQDAARIERCLHRAGRARRGRRRLRLEHRDRRAIGGERAPASRGRRRRARAAHGVAASGSSSRSQISPPPQSRKPSTAGHARGQRHHARRPSGGTETRQTGAVRIAQNGATVAHVAPERARAASPSSLVDAARGPSSVRRCAVAR